MKRFIFIYGPPGVGKSTSGQMLADALDMPFIDLDSKIETEAGVDIETIFETKGQEAFREMESAALSAAVNGKAQVVALGGGALLDSNNRILAEEHGQIICLDASLKILRKRLSKDGKPKRPLLKDNGLPELLTARKEHYESFTLHVDTEILSPSQIIQEIQILLGIFRIRGTSPETQVYIGEGLLSHLGELLEAASLTPPIAVISDSNVAEHYASPTLERLQQAGFDACQITFPAGEQSKNLEVLSKTWTEMLAAKMERSGTVLSLGGGVTNDLAGFAAATYMRGVSWGSIPSSLLAMVDASLGGKTGINLPEGKNLVGAFHPPHLVVIDTNLLSTLPEVEIINGLAEVVKHGVIGDAILFDLCAQGLPEITRHWDTVVKRAANVKIQTIQVDPYEKGVRAILNYGHTVGHAVEVLSKYGIRHGEAVAIGMVVETQLAEQMGLAPIGLSEKIVEVLTNLDLPTIIPSNIKGDKFIETMQFDKKRKGGTLRFALPLDIGEVVHDVEIENLPALMAEL
ncbi:MAG: 3-dehydroquinate synthase [Anaerolineales bacterium]